MQTREVAKVGSPGEIVAIVPQLLGFHPTESLVALSLRGTRARLGLTARSDLPPPGAEAALVTATVRALVQDGASACLLLVHTNGKSAAEHPHAAFVDALTSALQDADIAVHAALLVRDGRWWSYSCRLDCCPPEGTQVRTDAPVVQRLLADGVSNGRAVLPDRAALVASLQPVLPLGAEPVRAQQAAALTALRRSLEIDQDTTSRTELDLWRATLDDWEQQPRDLPGPLVARLVAALHVVQLRDEVVTWMLDRPQPLLGLLLQLSRACVSPDDAPLCAVIGWVAYGAGSGALALVATERALATDPGYSLALLVLEVIDRQTSPRMVRRVAQQARPELRRRRGRGGR